MSETTKAIVGVLPVFQTPYQDDESIDYDTLASEIDWLFEQGSDGVVMAMVSEVLRLSCEERDELAGKVCEMTNGRGCVVISVGAESSHTASRFAANAESAGADAVMAIPPVSVGVGPDELRAYYQRIFNAISLPVIVQDASGYVGQPMSIDFQASLLDEFGPERALFKPEAAPIGQRLSELRDATGGKAKVFEGTGGIALVDSYQRGVCGTIPGADLIRAIVPLWRALEDGDMARASRIHGPLSSLITLQNTLDSFLAVEKHLLVRQGVFKNEVVRGPRGYHLDDETRREVDRLFDLLLASVN
ncbi:MAG: dihydrodipicolinate synthase family protein [Verrucomicrobiales bacterium]|nr:dihydrodipicolinate synthase family protein [Verrucomicrobiales bacterium]|tara:strand:+ start:307 stop:1218 length:912 start_codon:yes stop_codon:yes gene_type:complete